MTPAELDRGTHSHRDAVNWDDLTPCCDKQIENHQLNPCNKTAEVVAIFPCCGEDKIVRLLCGYHGKKLYRCSTCSAKGHFKIIATL